MRKSAKVLVLAAVSLLGTVALAIGSAFSAALAFGAVALIVPGTGTPNANIVTNYLQNTENYYLRDTSCTAASNCALNGIDYPASFFPLAIFPSWCRSGPEGCDKWDESVGQGADGGPLGPGLAKELADALAVPSTTPGTPDIIVFGYSQGGAVVSKVLHDAPLTNEQKQRIQVVTIGGIENPDGGLWQRLAFLNYIPFLDITFAPPMPVDPNLKTTTIGFEYDPVVYAPRYWGNPLALLNALAAFETVHGNYLEPNGNDDPGDPGSLPYGYTPPTATDPGTLEPQLNCSTHPTNCRYDKVGNSYIMIPATSLPMYDLLVSLLPAAVQPYAKPFVDLLTPVTKVLVDLGYDWSGDPGTPTPLSILPFNPNQDFLKVAANLVTASIKGVQDFVKDLGNLGAAAQKSQAPVSPQVQALGAFSRLAGPDVQNDKQDNPIQDVSLVKDKAGVISQGSPVVQDSQNAKDGKDTQTGQGTPGPVQPAGGQAPADQNAGTPLTGSSSAPAQKDPVSQPDVLKSDGDNVVTLNRSGGSQQVVVKKKQDEKPVNDFGKQIQKSINDIKKLFGKPATDKKKDDPKPAVETKKDGDAGKNGDTAGKDDGANAKKDAA